MSDKKNINELADKIFDVKEKLTDEEYKNLIENVAKINNEINIIQPESIDHAEVLKQFQTTFFPNCSYPECDKESNLFSKYCTTHSRSTYKKTSEIKCKYKDTENNQCKKYANIGSEYCHSHAKNHQAKPPKKITTENFKCEFMIKEHNKSGDTHQCKKYALLGEKLCGIHLHT